MMVSVFHIQKEKQNNNWYWLTLRMLLLQKKLLWTCMNGLRSSIGIYAAFKNSNFSCLWTCLNGQHYPLWDEVKFNRSWDPHWYSRRVKKTVHIRLHPNNINRDRGIEIPESDSIASNHYHNRLLREQFPPLIIPTMLWIETHQPWARFMIHQSLTTMWWWYK